MANGSLDGSDYRLGAGIGFKYGRPGGRGRLPRVFCDRVRFPKGEIASTGRLDFGARWLLLLFPVLVFNCFAETVKVTDVKIIQIFVIPKYAFSIW